MNNIPSFSVPPNACVSSSAASPVVSVIIVSWNACKFLEECLDSLSRGISLSYEVIVVDNASSDGSPEMVTNKFPWVSLVQTGANLGFSKGNNIGIRQSRGRYLALVNSDVNVFPSCLDQLARFLDENPDAGMVGPRLLYSDHRLQSSCRRFPSLWNNFCEVFYLYKLFPRSKFFGGEHMLFFAYDRACEVEVIVGCFILARRSAVEQFGLLDESFFFYGEDLDWCRRCTDSGWKAMFCPDAEAIHYCGGSSTNDPTRFLIAQLKARLQLWGKYRSGWARAALVLLLTTQCIFQLASSLILRRAGRSKQVSANDRVKSRIAYLRALCGSLLIHK